MQEPMLSRGHTLEHLAELAIIVCGKEKRSSWS